MIWRALPENAVEKSKTDKSDKKDKTQLNLFIAAQLGVDGPVGAVRAPRLSHSKWGGDRGEVMPLHAPPAPTHR